MFLEKINLIQFKNIESSSICFSSKINCFVGDNGAGKTNIIDAIHYLSLSKSSLGVSDKACLMHTKDFFVIDGSYLMEDGSLEHVSCSYKKGATKKLKRNEKEYTKMSDHIGVLPLVMISPSDIYIINESGDERRRYLNSLLSQIDKTYLHHLMRYNALLTQRNNLLKNLKNAQQKEVLSILDEQMAEIGDKIYLRRKEMIEFLSPIVCSYYKRLSGDHESVNMKYISQIEHKSSLELLRSSIDKDCINMHTTTGVHRDDIKMEIMGHPIRRYGSQGQQKSFIIALKLAQFDMMTRYSKSKPILLLDDVFDKLDLGRVEELIKIVNHEEFGQIFITDCNQLRLGKILENVSQGYSLFYVKNGSIE